MQFDVYPNPSLGSRDRYPFVVDIQSDLLAGLATRLVMPLAISTMESDDGPGRLSPMIAINGRSYALIPFEAAPLDKRMLKRKTASIRNYASEVVAAMDAVMSGI